MDENEDVRDDTLPGYDPLKALTECYDLWASGAWPDDNAIYNLEEVMGHIENLIDDGEDFTPAQGAEPTAIYTPEKA